MCLRYPVLLSRLVAKEGELRQGSKHKQYYNNLDKILRQRQKKQKNRTKTGTVKKNKPMMGGKEDGEWITMARPEGWRSWLSLVDHRPWRSWWIVKQRPSERKWRQWWSWRNGGPRRSRRVRGPRCSWELRRPRLRQW